MSKNQEGDTSMYKSSLSGAFHGMESFLLQMMVQRQIWILDIMRDLLMRALIKTRM